MWESLKEHITVVWAYWWAAIPMLAAGILGIGLDIFPSIQEHDQILPLWVWLSLALSGIPIAQFLAFNKVRGQRNAIQAEIDRIRDGLLGNLALDRLHFGFGAESDTEVSVQPGFVMVNSADIAIRFKVSEFFASVRNRTVKLNVLIDSGIIPSGRERLFLYATIPEVPKEFPVECIITYTVQYGAANDSDYTHELQESLTATLGTLAGKSTWVYLLDSSEHKRLTP